MKILSCKLSNFASYKTLDFNFDSQGLNLIHGATGSGKSTLCDAIPWILFGKTAKNGTVDEVRSWGNDEITRGSIILQFADNSIGVVYRTRGDKSNDLYYGTSGAPIVRGKDLNDTQKLINNLLGLDAELYLSGAYFHEFSQTAQFFTTTPKNRRAICEQLADLTLPKKLHDKIKLEAKMIKPTLDICRMDLSSNKSNQDLLQKMLNKEIERALDWEEKKIQKRSAIQSKINNFEEDKQKRVDALLSKLERLPVSAESEFDKLIEELTKSLPAESEACKECGTPKVNKQRESILKEISTIELHKRDNSHYIREQNMLLSQLKSIESEQNTYQEQLDALGNEKCPAYEAADSIMKEITSLSARFVERTKQETALVTKQTDLEILSDITTEFRSNLIKNTVLDIETQTNVLLTRHFDAEIKIELLVDESDKLEVNITKDSNNASYTQLSKGQRQLLKLCFGVAVMKAVSNHHGIAFNQVFLDECLDGLDETMKLKAIGLLESLSLEYDSVFFVEHSEAVKAFVNNKYQVRLVNGNSEIEKEA